MQRYPIQVFWSDEDNAYIAIALDLEGCSAGGSTEIEAIQELHIAIELWLEAAREIGKPIPQPSYSDFGLQSRKWWTGTARQTDNCHSFQANLARV